MTYLRLLLCLCLVCALPGCADPRQKAEKTLQTVGADHLRWEAAVLYKRLFATRGLEVIALRPRDLPESFLRFKPLRGGAYPDGFTVTLTVKGDAETGLYIVPAGMDRSPKAGEGTKFQKISDGIYWYTFGL